MLHDEKCPGQVDIDRPLPHPEVEPVGAVVLAGEMHSGVCHDDVKAAPVVACTADRRRHLLLVADVRRQREHDVAELGHDSGEAA